MHLLNRRLNRNLVRSSPRMLKYSDSRMKESVSPERMQLKKLKWKGQDRRKKSGSPRRKKIRNANKRKRPERPKNKKERLRRKPKRLRMLGRRLRKRTSKRRPS